MTIYRLTAAFIVFLCVSLFSGLNLQAQAYNIATFDIPGSGTAVAEGTIAAAINDSGTVAGSYLDTENHEHGFIRAADGSLTTFDVTGFLIAGGGTQANTIDNAGEVAGDADDASPVLVGFVRSAAGVVSLIERSDLTNVATQLNSAGLCIGYQSPKNYPAVASGFLRYPNGNTVKIALPGANYTTPYGINSAGSIAGTSSQSLFGPYQGFVRSPGGAYSAFTIQGLSTNGLAINDSSTVAGEVTLADNSIHGFARKPDGSFTIFGVPSSDFVTVTAINNQGTIIGNAAASTGEGPGLVRLAGGEIVTLSVPGAVATYPRGINSTGVIAGTYTTGTLCCQTFHGFIATPSE